MSTVSLTLDEIFDLAKKTLLAVPFLEKYVTKSRYHTVVGDHEDLKKDLKRKHR